MGESTTIQLPAGVRRLGLQTHADPRGRLTEIFRGEWDTGVEPVQWNVVHSAARTLRGVHVHVRHWDYLVFLTGHTDLALVDLRRGSPTERLATFVPMRGEDLCALVVPPGVAHAFLTHEPAMLVYSVSHYWDEEDELAMRWDDPELGLDWPFDDPLVSARDAEAPPVSVLLDRLEPWQPFAGTY